MRSVFAVNGKTWTAPDGTPYPVTGYWCGACGLPRVPIAGMTFHPTCPSSTAAGGDETP